jgi:hypothetical protein
LRTRLQTLRGPPSSFVNPHVEQRWISWTVKMTTTTTTTHCCHHSDALLPGRRNRLVARRVVIPEKSPRVSPCRTIASVLPRGLIAVLEACIVEDTTTRPTTDSRQPAILLWAVEARAGTILATRDHYLGVLRCPLWAIAHRRTELVCPHRTREMSSLSALCRRRCLFVKQELGRFIGQGSRVA